MKQTNGTKKLLSQVWHLTRSYWKSEEKKKAYALLLAILVLTLAVVAMLVLLNQWNIQRSRTTRQMKSSIS